MRWALLVLAGCYDLVDTSQPIVLAPAADMDLEHRRAIELAAESWNLELGTDLRVSNVPTSDQTVLIEFWKKEECEVGDFNFAGLVHPMIGSPHIYMCPEHTRDRLPYFFQVMRHEIGHVLGLRHVGDDHAVMGVPERDPRYIGPLIRFFTPDDRAEFEIANPDFVGNGGCSINHLIAQGWPSAIVTAEGEPHLIWGSGFEISFAPIDPSTGDLAAEPIAMTLTATISRLFAQPIPAGFSAIWSDEDGLRQMIMTGEPQIRTLPIEWSARGRALASSTGSMLAIASFDGRRTELIELGPGGEAVASTIAAGRGFLVQHGDRTFYAGAVRTKERTRRVRVASVRREADRLALSESLDIGLVNLDFDIPLFLVPLSTAGASDGLLLFIDSVKSTSIVRVRGDLTVDRRIDLGTRLLQPSFVEVGDRLIISGWRKPEGLFDGELFVAELDRATLELLTDWRRISAPDQLSGGEASLWFGGGQLVAAWGEGLGELRTRCLAWDTQ